MLADVMVYSATELATVTAPVLMVPSLVRIVHVPLAGAVKVAPSYTGQVRVLFRPRSMA
jgi:hypothetical protein